MSDAVAIAVCLAAAFLLVLGSLRCLADHLLPSAVIYAVIALGFLGAAAKVAIGSF